MLNLHGMFVPLAIGGAVVAYLGYRLAYRRSSKRGTFNLPDEVRKERDSLCAVVEALPEQLELAKRSRLAIAETQGRLGSEATQQWLKELEADLAETRLLGSQIPAADTDATDQSVMQWDIKLVEILALSIRVNGLADKYRLSVSADDSESSEELISLQEGPTALHPSMSLSAPS